MAPKLDLPPPYRLVTLREVGDAFAHATAHRGRAGRRHAGLRRALRSRRIRRGAGAGGTAAHRAARALCRHGGAGRRARRRMRRRRSRSPFDWPDAIRVDGGLVGGGRIAWPEGRRRRAAGLAGVRRHDPHRVDGGGRAGPAPARRGAGGRGLRRSRLRPAGRELRAPPDGARSTPGRRTASRRSRRNICRACRPKAASRRDIDENGDLLVRRTRQGRGRAPRAADAQARRDRPGSIPADRRPAARETDPHHPARSVGHVRVRARRRAGRMGGVGRLRVLRRRSRRSSKARRARRSAAASSASNRSAGRRWCRSSRQATQDRSRRGRCPGAAADGALRRAGSRGGARRRRGGDRVRRPRSAIIRSTR